MFNPGQEVVCIRNKPWAYPDGYQPSFGETVTVDSLCRVYPDCIFIREYPRAKDGALQCFGYRYFVPKEDWQQAETMVEVLKEDLELVETI
jgi:hypothetical protein